MSTPTEATKVNSWGDEPTEVKARPKMFVTGKITGLGECKTTGGGDGDYERAEILISPTRGSRPIKASFMFRPEMFAKGFNASTVYGRNDENDQFVPANPAIAFIPEGKSKPLAHSFATVYSMNLKPDKYEDKHGQMVFKKHTPLSAIAGGDGPGWLSLVDTILSFQNTIPESREANELGLVCPTPAEVMDMLKGYISAHPQNEQVFELRQERDRDGYLTDFYGVNRFLGALDNKLVERLRTRVEKTANEDLTRKVVMGFSL